jgi:hypothetical protein
VRPALAPIAARLAAGLAATTLAAAALAAASTGCRSPGSSPVPEAHADEPARALPAGPAGAVAVVELFTSEGCSSCPPADALLADLARDPRVVALSFHVDYWDELGWPDRFASPEATSRQHAYAAAFGTRGLYTPQLVVQGTDAFTGSDRGHAVDDLAGALARAPAFPLTVRAKAAGAASPRLDVDYDAPGVPAGSTLVVALVEKTAVTQVRAGENAGKTLRHVDVVRAFATAPAAASGHVALTVPASLRREDGMVVAFVQHADGGKPGLPVLAAARTALPSAG